MIDTQTTSRLALPMLLRGIDFTGSYETTEQFLIRPPDAAVVVMDLHLAGSGKRPERKRFDAVRAVTSAGYQVCVYTGERTHLVLVAALMAGATGILHKREPIADLESALHRVAAGETVITPALARLAETASGPRLM